MVDRMRAQSFDGVAELYDDARPTYPDDLFDELFAWIGQPASVQVLEVGAGTGKATAGLVARGARVTAVEPGTNLAALLRANHPEVTVIEATFESAALDDARYDCIVSASAWHWVDPVVALPKVAAHLVADGRLAVWWAGAGRVPPGDDPYARALGPVLDRYLGSRVGGIASFASAADTIEASGLFTDVEVLTFPTEFRYDTERFVALLQTYSDVATLAPEVRAQFVDEVRSVIDTQLDGGVVHRIPVPMVRARKR